MITDRDNVVFINDCLFCGRKHDCIICEVTMEGDVNKMLEKRGDVQEFYRYINSIEQSL